MDSAPCHVHLAARLLGFFQLLEAGGLGFGGGFPFTRGKRKRKKRRRKKTEPANPNAHQFAQTQQKRRRNTPHHTSKPRLFSFLPIGWVWLPFGAGVPISKPIQTNGGGTLTLVPCEQRGPSPGFLSSLHLPLLVA